MDDQTPKDGFGNKILHPKLSNKFAIRWNVALPNYFTEEQIAEAEALLRGLSAQLVSVELPVEEMGAAIGNSFSLVRHIGPVVFVFEDDVTNVVTRALNLFTRAEIVNALVMKLNGDETVLEAHLLNTLTFNTLKHSVLNYGSSSSVQKTVSARVNSMLRTHNFGWPPTPANFKVDDVVKYTFGE